METELSVLTDRPHFERHRFAEGGTEDLSGVTGPAECLPFTAWSPDLVTVSAGVHSGDDVVAHGVRRIGPVHHGIDTGHRWRRGPKGGTDRFGRRTPGF